MGLNRNAVSHVVTIIGTPELDWKVTVSVGQEVCLVKQPQNYFDAEAIRVLDLKKGHIGYVANSIKTVMLGTLSAGRVYDKIGNCAKGVVRLVAGDRKIAVVEIVACNERL